MLSAENIVDMRLQMIGVSIALFTSFLGVGDKSLGGAVVGLVLAYSLPLTGNLSGLISSLTETEKEIVSVERIMEYANLEAEEPRAKEALQKLSGPVGGHMMAFATQKSCGMWIEQQRRIQASEMPKWPSKGFVTFDQVKLVYRAGLAPALNNISLKIRGGERIGIVGTPLYLCGRGARN